MLDPRFDRIFGRADARIAVLEEMPVGASLAAGLVALRSMQMDGYAAVRVHALWNKLIAWATAQQMIATNDSINGVRGLIEPLYDPTEPHLIAAQELAAACSVTYGTARAQVDLVDRISHCMPECWEALDRGDLTLSHVRAFHRATQDCAPHLVKTVEAEIIPLAIARKMTPSQLARATARLLITLDPDGAEERAEAAKDRADVELYPGPDETASLHAFGDAAPLVQVMDELDERAAAMKRAGDPRPIGALRVQALTDAILGSSEQPNSGKVTTHVLVTIDLPTLLGLNQNPGELAGYGPITAETARQLATDATLSRLVMDPMTGEALDLGRTYQPSKLLRRLVQASRPRCSMVGCSRPAYQCEIDHRLEHAQGGDTNPENLQPLCKLHHELKTKKRWKVGVNAEGQQSWTSFLGFTYVSYDRDPLISDSDPPAEAA
jgi:hypothetical protein